MTSLLGIIALIFIGCSSEPKKEAVTKTLQFWTRPVQQAEVMTNILDVEVSAIAILPDGKEVVVKKFDTPPAQEINGIAHLKVSDTSEIELDLPIKGIAHVTIGTDTGLKVLRLPYLLQRKGDLISPTCGNSFRLAKK
ncbi:MAG: hypothetical protein ACOYMZ_00850 [Minisyncoccia bacterium]